MDYAARRVPAGRIVRAGGTGILAKYYARRRVHEYIDLSAVLHCRKDYEDPVRFIARSTVVT